MRIFTCGFVESLTRPQPKIINETTALRLRKNQNKKYTCVHVAACKQKFKGTVITAAVFRALDGSSVCCHFSYSTHVLSLHWLVTATCCGESNREYQPKRVRPGRQSRAARAIHQFVKRQVIKHSARSLSTAKTTTAKCSHTKKKKHAAHLAPYHQDDTVRYKIRYYETLNTQIMRTSNNDCNLHRRDAASSYVVKNDKNPIIATGGYHANQECTYILYEK